MNPHPEYATTLTHYLALATVPALGVVIALVVYVLYVIFVTKKSSHLLTLLSTWVLPLSFVVSFVGMSLSLFYSQVLHYAPCELCWYQRIFLYSQVFIFGFAWYRMERTILPYALLLSLIGGSIAVYHHMLQIGFDLMKPCSTAPFAVDCAKPEFIEFGFVTFPLMSAVLFGMLIVLVSLGIWNRAGIFKK